MRLRPLSEAECYARCYLGQGDQRVSLLRLERRVATNADRLRELRGDVPDGRASARRAA